MTPRPSRPHLGPGHSTSDHNAAPAPLCQLWTCRTRAPKSQALGVRHGSRLPRVPTPSQRARTPPARASTPRSAPSQAPRGTQRDEAAQVGRVHPKPARCSPFGDAKGFQTPLSSNILHTPKQAGEDASSDQSPLAGFRDNFAPADALFLRHVSWGSRCDCYRLWWQVDLILQVLHGHSATQQVVRMLLRQEHVVMAGATLQQLPGGADKKNYISTWTQAPCTSTGTSFSGDLDRSQLAKEAAGS
jgi:hypothetical protein